MPCSIDFLCCLINCLLSETDLSKNLVDDLVNGRLDAVIVDSNPAAVFAANYPDKIKDLNGEDFGFEIEEYAIALPKGDAALKEAIDVAITKIKDNGTFDKLVDEYM